MQDLKYQIKDLIKDISFTLQRITLYGSQHPKAGEAIDRLYEKFKLIFERLDEVSFGLVGEEIFYEKEVFFDLTTQVKDFIKVLKEKDIEYMKFRKGLNLGEIRDFLELLSIREKEGTLQPLKDVFEDRKFSYIEAGKFGAKISPSFSAKKESARKSLLNLNSLYEASLNEGSAILKESISAQELNLPSLLTLITRLLNLLVHQRNSLFILWSIKKHDDYTFVHCLNVSLLTMFQAKILGLPQEKVVRLGIAGFLHDIGKIAVKRMLLEKKEKLTEEEFKNIKNHVILGAKIFLRSSKVDKLSFIVSFQHHLGFNLEGYPKIKFLKKQNLASKLVCISDVYDALRTKRSYRESMPLERVYGIMKKEAGRLFDPFLLELFFKNLGIWPVGTLVKLDTQEVGLVRENNPEDIFRPKVEILYDSKEDRLEKSFLVDLTDRDENGDFKRRILRHLSPLGEGRKFILELFGEV